MRGVTRGVFRFLRGNPNWRIVGEGHHPLLGWDQLAVWEGDGLIAIANSQEQLDALLAADVPVVNAGSRLMHDDLPCVATDSRAIGTLAAEHLLGCGLQHFLFVGEMTWENERHRQEGFATALQAAGRDAVTVSVPMHEYTTSDASAHYQPDMVDLSAAICAVEKPVGIFAPNSVIARTLVDAAESEGFQVPDQVAVLGVNDDPLVCESTIPPLSAVMQPSEQIGLEAARRLNELMFGREETPRKLFLPPVGVVGRASTDMLAVEDAGVATALRFIRENAERPIEVTDVAEFVDLSRRSLETKFAKSIGRSPAAEIRRVRIERAKRLLAETSDPITNVVFASGFNSRQVFSSIFRRETGMTPTDFRRQFQMDILR